MIQGSRAWFVAGTFLVLAAQGCRRSPETFVQVEFRSIADSLIAATLRRDTVAIQKWTTGQVPQTRILAMFESNRDLLEAFGRGPKEVDALQVRGDSAYVVLRFSRVPSLGANLLDEKLHFGFARTGNGWKVYYVARPI